MTLRPKMIHFITGMQADFGGRPFILPHALAILSARLAYPDHEIRVCFAHEPSGALWEYIKPMVTRVEVEAPTEIFGQPISHYAHSADVVRLQQLIAHGGLYFDTDTIVLRPISDLPDDRLIMGLEHGVDGLCNAFIAAPKNDIFLRNWLDRYRDFDKNDWGGHSIRLPFALAQELPEHIHIEPETSFFTPHHDPASLSDLFEKIIDTDLSYSIHLWESLSWDWLKSLTPETIARTETTYNLQARKVLAAFPKLVEAIAPHCWQVQIVIERSALPREALDRSPFWYLALHDEDEKSVVRQDADMAELQQISSGSASKIILVRHVNAVEPPTRWTVQAVDRNRQWLAPLTGKIDMRSDIAKVAR